MTQLIRVPKSEPSNSPGASVVSSKRDVDRGTANDDESVLVLQFVNILVETRDERSPYEVIMLAADGLGGAEINSHKCASLKTDNARSAYQELPLPMMGEQVRPLSILHEK